MEESSQIVYFVPCVSCGKTTFKDLLDQELRCEYCRELKKTRPRVRRSKKAKAEKR